MPVIPRSQGVLARPTTETGMRAPSMAQSQIIPKAIQGASQDLVDIGVMWQNHKAKQQEEYDASQALDFKNRLKDFENQKKIELAQAPNTQEVISDARNRILEEREQFIQTLSSNFEGNNRLLKLTKQQQENSLVDFKFGLDKEIISKQRKFQQDTLYKNLSSIRKRYESAVDFDDFSNAERDLENELQTALSIGTIDLKGIDQYQESFRQLRKARQEKVALQESTRQVLSGELLIDPSDKKQANALNDVFSEALATGQVDDPIRFGEEFATSTGIMPKQFKSFLSGQVLGGTPEQRVNASLSVVEILESDKSSVLQNQIPANVKALAREIVMRNEAGISPTDSVKFATEQIEKNKDQERSLRSAMFESELKSSTGEKTKTEIMDEIIDDLEDESAGFFEREAKVPVKMAQQVRTLARDLYLNEGMGFDAAMEEAKAKIKSEWHITDVGEKRYQRFAPERFYRDMTSKEIQAQAVNKVKKSSSQPFTDLKKEIYLTIIPASIQRQPSYFVGRKKSDGSIEQIFDDSNQPIVFTPDITKTQRYIDGSEARKPLTRKELISRTKKKRRGEQTKQEFLNIMSPI